MMRNLRFAGCTSINIIVLILAIIPPALALVAFVASALTCIIFPSLLRSTLRITLISLCLLKQSGLETHGLRIT